MINTSAKAPKAKGHGQFTEVIMRLAKNPGAMIGLSIFLAVLVLTLLSPIIAPYDAGAIDIVNAFTKPCSEHLFGTDQLGRDNFSRILVGAKYSITIGLGAELLSLIGAVILGSLAGFFGGRVDNLIMRICDVIQSVPGVILQIALCCVLGAGFWNTILVLGIAGISGGTRLMRSSILKVRKMEYLDAATSINCSSFRSIFKHVLPNAFAPMIVHVTMNVGGRILSAAGLSYLGMGVSVDTPEWGAMVSAGRDFIKSAPYLSLIPGLCIMVLVLSLNLFGDGLRDALDPKLKK